MIPIFCEHILSKDPNILSRGLVFGPINWFIAIIFLFLARPAFSLLRPRSSNRLEAAEEAEEEEEDKVLSLILKPSQNQ